MAYDPSRHHRRSIRLPGYDYGQVGLYYVTVVTAGRECLLGQVEADVVTLTEAGQAVLAAWQDLPTRYPSVVADAIVIMPNHVHAVIGIVDRGGAASSAPTNTAPTSAAGDGPTLGAVMRAWKSLSAAGVNRVLARTGSVWQRNYYEHIVRDEDDLARIHQYMAGNPARWGRDGENPAAGMRAAMSD